MNHLEDIENIARAACALYGHDWNKIPMWSRDIWRISVRDTPRNGGEAEHEKAAGRAIDAWYKAQEDASNPLITPAKVKPKKK
jgi:hypothetical protein